jgi:hypothetical protein
MTDSNPNYINELQSDLRGIKEGWYAIDERGNLLSGPFSNRERCLTTHQPISELGSIYAPTHRALESAIVRLVGFNGGQ